MLVNQKYKLILSIFAVWFIAGCSVVFAGSNLDSETWKQVETTHTIIRYKTDKDLLLFHKSVNFGPGSWNKSSLFSDLSAYEVQEMVSLKVDGIFKRAQEILDMKKIFKKISINIFSDSKGLKEAYTKIYKGRCNVRAWYRYRNNTVYINVQDVHDGMLAHELAHGIIDHFLLVKPPSQTAEILARYVDAHL